MCSVAAAAGCFHQLFSPFLEYFALILQLQVAAAGLHQVKLPVPFLEFSFSTAAIIGTERLFKNIRSLVKRDAQP
jgi:hypothetical protein